MLKFVNNHPYMWYCRYPCNFGIEPPTSWQGRWCSWQGYPRVLQGAGRIVTTRRGIRNSVRAIRGRQITKGPGTIVDVAAKSDHLRKFESIAQTVAPGVVADTFPTTKLIQQLTEEGYFTGVGGKIFRNITKGKIKAIGAAARSGKRDEAMAGRKPKIKH